MKRFFIAIFALTWSLTASEAALAVTGALRSTNQSLNVVLSPTVSGANLLGLLLMRFPELKASTPVRKVLTVDFYQHLSHRLTPKSRDETLSLFRKSLASAGYPTALTAQELVLFESDPDHLEFTFLNQISFEGFARGPSTIAGLLEANGLLTVGQFLKVYNREMAKPVSYRFKDLYDLGPVGMHSAHQAIQSFLLSQKDRILIDDLKLSYAARAALNSAKISGYITPTDLKNSPLEWSIILEIGVADMARRQQLGKKVRQACDNLLVALGSGKI